MSEATAFDSHRFVKKLTACGFTEKQAEALADEQARQRDGDLVTKADLEKLKDELLTAIQTQTQQVKTGLEGRIQEVKTDLEGQIHRFKADLEGQIQQVKADLEVQIQQVKADLEVQIQQVKADFEVQIQQVKADLEVQMQKFKADIMKWMFAAVTAQTGVLAGLVVALIRFSVPGE